MKISKALPIPSTDARQHSKKLYARILREINQQDGSISFRRYMEMALYEPGLGYYVAGKRKFGKGGDFVTAPEVSPLFSQCIANQCLQVLESLNRGEILELGAGSGKMAADILLHLETKDGLPDRYYILDLSPELKALQRNTLEERCPRLLPRVQWLSALPLPETFSGVILANEVLDAMPVELFHIKKGSVYQQHVGLQEGDLKLVHKKSPEHSSFSQKVSQRINKLDFSISTDSKHPTKHNSEYGSEYSSEFNPNIDAWIQQLENTLEQGLILLIDYGYTRREYYHPERNSGTLICHYQHLVHQDFFWNPGLQDITANVDFTHVAEAADNNGLSVSGFTSQAAFLTGCGLEDLFVDELTKNPEQQYQLAQQVRTLSLPSEMGERFKIIALCKKFNNDLIGFSTMDYRHKL
ncbi:MAG: SAM-dependent methyltransferase [Thiotrichaceae bacterium]